MYINEPKNKELIPSKFIDRWVCFIIDETTIDVGTKTYLCMDKYRTITQLVSWKLYIYKYKYIPSQRNETSLQQNLSILFYFINQICSI